MRSGGQEDYLVPDLVAHVLGMKRSQGSDPTTDACSALRCECDAGMLETLGCEPEEVLVVSTEDPSHLGRSPEMIRIVMAQCVQITGRHNVNP